MTDGALLFKLNIANPTTMKRFKNNPDTLFRISGLKRALSALSFLFLSFSLLNGQTADFTASSVTVCAGSSITFTDNSIGTTGTVTYSWNFGTGANPATATDIGPHTVIYSTPGTVTVSLTITDDVGSSTKIDYITVNPNATITLTSGLPSSDQTICILSLLTPITYQVSGGGTGADVTDLPTGITGSYSGGIFTISGTPTQSGIFNYTVTTTGTCTQTTATGTISVIALPVATASNNGPVCQGSALTLTGGPVGMTSYSWTGPNGFTSSAQSPTVSTAATLLMSGDYTLTVTNSNGCTNNVNTTVMVNPLPAPVATSNSPICETGLLRLTGAPNGMTSYSWTGPGGFTSSVQNPTVSATTAMNGIFTLTVTNSNGCVNSATTDVIVNPLPSATITGSLAVCQDSPSPSITFTGSGGTAPYTFTYRINSGGIQTVTSTSGSSVSVSAPSSVPGIYEYELISVRDGTSTACEQPQSGIATITVNPLPQATISGTTIVCQNDEGPLITFTGSNGTPPYTFTYTINSGDPITITTSGSNNSITLQAPTNNVGAFTYALQSVRDGSSTGCSRSISGTATITVLPLPTATVGGTTAVCRNATSPGVTFTGYSGTAPYTFIYTINGGEFRTATSNSGNSVTLLAPTTTAGVFRYDLVSVSDASSQACGQLQTGSAVITVNPLPVAAIGGTAAVCQFSPEPVITFTGSAGTAPYTFTYRVNGGSSQTVVSTGNIATVSVPTNLAGLFSFDLISVRDNSSTGCSQSAIGNATVTVNPLPTATIIGSVNVCQLTPAPQIIFTGAAGTVPYTFTYRINGGGPLTVTTAGTNSSIAVPVSTAAPGTFTYELISVRDGSSSSCLQSQSGTAVVRVNPLPQATISGTTQVCRNSASPPVTFTGTNGTAPYTFTYRVNGGSEQTVTSTGSVATIAAPTATAGVFTYQLLGVQDASSTACTRLQSGTAVITVNALPATSVITGNATPPCEANGQVYSVTLTPGSTYLWSVPDGATIVNGVTGPANNSITVDFGTNNGNIGVIETNASGCAGAERTLAISLQGCDLNPNFTVSNTSVCSGSSVIFTDLSSGTTSNTTYSWSFGADAVPATANDSGPHTVTYTGTGTRSVRLTLLDGATETELKTNYITINPLPTATISGTTAVCENSISPLVRFTGSGGTQPYTFVYTINGGSEQVVTTTLGSNVSVPVPTGTPGSYSYNLVSVSDGSSTACGRPVTGSVTVTVNPLPSATMTGTATVCRFDTPPLITFTGSGGTTPYTFRYRINGSGAQTVTTSGTSSTVTIPVSTLATGTFTYELISVRDGSSTSCEQSGSDIATVRVNPLPAASISGTTAVCRYSESPNITFTGTLGTPPYIFTYSINSGPELTITTVVGSSVTLPVPTTAAGTFTYSLVRVVDRNGAGCSQSTTGGATVTVNPLPTATLTGTTAVCEGAPAPSVTFTGANGTEPYVFTYRLNGGNYQTIAAPSGSSVTISVPTGVPGTYSYELISVRDASSTSCSQVQTGVAVVTVNPLPTATISGTANVCQNTTGTMVTFTGSNGTSPYTFTYNINSGTTRTVTTPAGENSVSVQVPTSSVGVFTYSLMMVRDASTTACGGPMAGSATITVLPLPTATITGTTTVCAYDSYPVVTFTGSAGSAPYTFIYNINGGGDLSVTTTGTSSVSIAVPTETAGVYRYRLVAVIDGSTNSCSNTQEGEAVVTIRALPTATITGGGILCRNDPRPVVTFTGSGGTTPYTFTYTRNGGTPLTITTTTGRTVTVQVPTDTPGNFEYVLLGVSDAGNPACSQAQSGTALFTVNPLPTATISGNNVVCRDDPAPEISFRGSGGTPPYTFTYTINRGAPRTVSTEPGRSTITITAPTATAGNYIYELVSVRDGSLAGCLQSQTGSIQITVNRIPVANAGAGGEVCGPAFQLNATPDIGSGVWSMVSGTGSASFSPSINDPHAVVTVTQYGLKRFTWTESNGGCSDDATVEVMFWEMPVVNAGANSGSCNLRFGLKATPGIGTGRWSMTRGGGTATFYPNAYTPNAVVEVTQYGQKDFTWTEVNGTCTASDIVEVTFYRQPVADPGSGGNNCGRIFNLRARPSYGTGTWTVASGPGTAVFRPNANSPTATVEVSAYGTYQFTWTEVNGSCSDFGTIPVRFIQAIPADGGEGGVECDLDFVFNATPVTDNGFWSKLSGPGSAFFNPSQDDPSATVTVDQYGRYEFGWTELNVVCQSTDIVVVEFHPVPALSTIRDTAICRGGSVELITTGEGNFLWTPAFFLDSINIQSPSATPDSTLQYIVTLTDQYGCMNRDTVLIAVMEQPVAYAGPDQIIDYAFNAQLQATLRAGETGTWSITSGEGTFDDISDPQTMIYRLSLGDNVLQWIVTNGVCPESADQVTITVNELIIPTLITPNGDHLNEYFELRGIETLGVIELIIFDRGGTQVYKSSNYANDWNGVDQHGNPLPEDTYFYVMKPQNGKARSGYIVIRR